MEIYRLFSSSGLASSKIFFEGKLYENSNYLLRRKTAACKKIISLIPSHEIYCEPFVGGGAVFFQKEPSKSEIINDINGELINFYEVVQRDFSLLAQEVIISLHSRKLHHHARVVNENPDMFDRIKRAWAVWVLANSSFGASWDAGWGYDAKGQTTRKLKNKREAFTEELAIRLQDVQIECYDALKILRTQDTPHTRQRTDFLLLRPTISRY